MYIIINKLKNYPLSFLLFFGSFVINEVYSIQFNNQEILNTHQMFKSTYHRLQDNEITKIKKCSPGWNEGFIKSNLYKGCCEKAQIYAPKGAMPMDAYRFLKQVVPVDIARKKLYDESKLKSLFGWDESFWTSQYKKTNNPLPSIGIYIHSPVCPFRPLGCGQNDDLHREIDGYTESCPNCIANLKNNYSNTAFDENVFSNNNNMAHLYYTCGPAFDSEEQVDYKYYLTTDTNNNVSITPQREKELIKFMEEVINGAFICASQNQNTNITEIVMPLISCGAFAKKYPGGKIEFFNKIFLPAFKNSFNRNIEKLKNGKVKTISTIGNNTIMNLMLSEYIKTLSFSDNENFKSNAYGMVPDIFFDDNINKFKNALFVVPGDPNSAGGNGFLADPSLDGSFGANTALNILAWPPTNPYIKKQLDIINLKRKLYLLIPLVFLVVVIVYFINSKNKKEDKMDYYTLDVILEGAQKI